MGGSAWQLKNKLSHNLIFETGLTDNKTGVNILKNQMRRMQMNQRLHSTDNMARHHRRICL